MLAQYIIRLVLLVFIFPFAKFSHAQGILHPRDEGSAVKFDIRNFGINVTGSFKGLKGDVRFDRDEPGKAQFDVTVDVNTINTGINLRDSDLKKEKYFDAEKYPEIRMTSEKITRRSGGDNEFMFEGHITIKGTRRAISFPFTASPSGKGYVFKASFPLNRRWFKVGGSSFSLSDDLTVSLAVLVQ